MSGRKSRGGLHPSPDCRHWRLRPSACIRVRTADLLTQTDCLSKKESRTGIRVRTACTAGCGPRPALRSPDCMQRGGKRRRRFQRPASESKLPALRPRPVHPSPDCRRHCGRGRPRPSACTVASESRLPALPAAALPVAAIPVAAKFELFQMLISLIRMKRGGNGGAKRCRFPRVE